MSLANLKKMKKELLLINKNNNKHKLLIQALDGLFLIDLSKIDERRVAPVDEAPEGMDIEIIGANIDDIIIAICFLLFLFSISFLLLLFFIKFIGSFW